MNRRHLEQARTQNTQIYNVITLFLPAGLGSSEPPSSWTGAVLTSLVERFWSLVPLAPLFREAHDPNLQARPR